MKTTFWEIDSGVNADVHWSGKLGKIIRHEDVVF